MRISYLVFDLDETLYPSNNGLWEELGQRILRYMIERMGFDPATAQAAREAYFRTHGTTLRGLMTDFPKMDVDEFLAYVHDLDLGQWISPDPKLDSMLAALPQPKAIFTNADTAHARRIINRLGVARHFNTIVDIRAMKFENKPRPQAYAALLDTLHVPAAACVLVEDSLRNLRPARQLGMTTILVGDGSTPDRAANFSVPTVLDVGEVIRRLAQDG